MMKMRTKVNVFQLRPGDIAEFNSPKNGFFYDIKVAAQHLTKGKSYIVAKKEVHNWHTKIWLEEIPDVQFNSCFFDFWHEEKNG